MSYTLQILMIPASALFHYVCYFFLARRMVLSRGYTHRNVYRFAFYMAIWPFLWSVGLPLGSSDAPDFIIFLGGFGVGAVSFFVWLYIFLNAGHTGFDFSASSVALCLPVIGPIVALLWLAYSYNMNELFGFASDEEAGRRRHLFAVLWIVVVGGGIIYGIHDKFFNNF